MQVCMYAVRDVSIHPFALVVLPIFVNAMRARYKSFFVVSNTTIA